MEEVAQGKDKEDDLQRWREAGVFHGQMRLFSAGIFCHHDIDCIGASQHQPAANLLCFNFRASFSIVLFNFSQNKHKRKIKQLIFLIFKCEIRNREMKMTMMPRKRGFTHTDTGTAGG